MENQQNKDIDTSLDIAVIFKEIGRKWYLYLIMIIIAVPGSYLYNKYAVKEYMITSTVLINMKEQVGRNDNRDYLSQDNMGYFGQNVKFTNELLNFSSTPLISKAIGNLNVKVSYYIKSHFNYHDIYLNSPFRVVFDENDLQIVGVKFKIKFLDANKCHIECTGNDVKIYSFIENKDKGLIPEINFDQVVEIGKKVETKFFNFVVLANQDLLEKADKDQEYAFEFNNLFLLARRYKGNLVVSRYNEESSVLNVEFTHSNPNLGIDFIESLTEEYMKLNLDKKNHAATQTINYIDSQIGKIEDSLSITENELQRFRASHQFLNIEEKSRSVQEQLLSLENEKTVLENRIQYYSYLYQNVQQESDELSNLIAPSTMGIEDPLLTNLISELVSYSREKNTIEQNNQQKSPRYSNINIQIENIRNTIGESLNNIINTSNLSLDKVNQRIRALRAEVQKLPGTKRELMGLERKFSVDNEIYTFLLQRRAESEIAKASSLPDNELIEPPVVAGIAKPKKNFIYAAAVILALFLPSIFVLGRILFNTKIINKNDLLRIKDVPFLGSIYHNENKLSDVVFTKNPHSSISESFRTILTNIEFLLPDKKNKIFVITSTFSGEGKSFFALNLAFTLALYNKKVALVDFDLRKPTINKKLGISNNIGVTDFLINKANFHDVIVGSDLEKLDIITSGETPPNPSELIASGNTKELINFLREQYEYVIIDSSPIGLVPDSNYLIDSTDFCLYISRQNYTDIKGFVQNISEIKSRFPNKLATILNDYIVEKSNTDYSYSKKYNTYYGNADKEKK